MPTDPPSFQDFIAHWQKAEANERANSQSFLIGLTQILGVSPPSNSHYDGYSFEFPVKVPGGTSTNFIDLYRRGHFVLESKQFTAQKLEQTALELVAIEAGAATDKKKSGPVRGSGSWDDAMIRAKGQAERYVRSLPADEPNPPFILVCDVGHSFEVYADFTQAGKAYLPFPDPRTFRIKLADLEREDVRERLRLIWTNPTTLDPAKVSADVTREIAGYLAELAKSLEQEKHDPEVVAQFLTRCLFCMFAEDVGLLPDHAFTELLHSVPGDGTGFPELLGTLFREMNTGTGNSISVVLRKKLLKFNGGLFADHTVLPVNGFQLGLLKQAAKTNWKHVEPAIFGTLLERALVPEERHALGAHFTPRAYVERLVLPTVIEPLREEWENVRAAAITHAARDDLKNARKEINAFHEKLCQVRVLDPACGSGNFLYVALQHLKILEGEVLDTAAQFGEDMKLELETHTIDPHQFLGIELNPRAASIAELVLWIGYLQWHFRIHGQRTPPEPILRAFKNIECRDAVLAYDGAPVPARDEAGNIRTVWDRRSTKTDLVTNRNVPDESKRVPLLTYENPRFAQWPEADFIVGNPPFIGAARMREDLGDGYAETLRRTYPEVPESADFVLYWWHKAALLVRSGQAWRFGLITTNSLRQTFARRIVEAHLKPKETDLPSPGKEGLGKPLSLIFAIPDHPWVDTAEGADVRIAMTVGVAGDHVGILSEVIDEEELEDGSAGVFLRTQLGKVSADLTIGADVAGSVALQSNRGLSSMGVKLHGMGFILNPDEAAMLRLEGADSVIKPYLCGRDLVQQPRVQFVIDLFGLEADQVRQRFPRIYQHVFLHVKPERDANARATYRDNWWIFGEPRRDVRPALADLTRIITTTRTAKHRIFSFQPSRCLFESEIIMIAIEDAFHLGVLGSRPHVGFSLAAGGTLEDRPRYNNSVCFDPFPFPLCDDAHKERIRVIAEELDAHRKRVQAAHPGLTLTGMYNVLEKLRAGKPLSAKEKVIHDEGLVSILKQLHDDLDAAVFAAYGWEQLWEAHLDARHGSMLDFQTGTTIQLDCDPEGFAAELAKFEKALDAEILTRLVALNAQRAAEEKEGIIHWLRPDYQIPASQAKAKGKGRDKQGDLQLTDGKGTRATKKTPASKAKGKTKTPWPKPLAQRIHAVETALHAAPTSVTAADLAAQFSRAKPADLQEILESLVTLGRAQQDGDRFGV